MTATRLVGVLVLFVAGCRSSSGGGSRSVIVTAFGEDRVEPGVRVIGHAPDGEVIDQTVADAVGRAEVGVDDDSLVSVIFPASVNELTPTISVVTVPAAGDELTIHGPARSGAPPLIVGVLKVTGPALPGAAYFEIRLGCASARVTQLPATLDIGACSMGSDTKLDVLVTGAHDVGGDPPAPVLDGYAAGRVAMTNGIAMLDIAAWQTTGTSVPVVLDGVMPVVDLTLISDGLPMSVLAVTDHATLWTDLPVDAARVTAALVSDSAARVTTREVAGAPTEIALAADDFLPSVPVTAAIASLSPTTITWDAAGIGDAVNLHARWERVVWDVVLPPDAGTATLPRVTGQLASLLTPSTIVPPDVLVRYVDSEAHDGFAALLAAGVHAEETLQASTIAPRPTTGDIRVSHAIGVR